MEEWPDILMDDFARRVSKGTGMNKHKAMKYLKHLYVYAAAALVLVLSAGTTWAGIGTGKVTYIHNDPFGNPIVATDASGNRIWRENYLPFGYKLAYESQSDNFGFSGKPYDKHTELSYYGARYYNPLMGRFIGVDPLGVNPYDLHSFNRYVYGNNNPYRYTDADGRVAVPVVFFAGAAIVGGIVWAKLAHDRHGPEYNSRQMGGSDWWGSSEDNRGIGIYSETKTSSWNVFSENENKQKKEESDNAVEGLTGELPNETDKRGRPVKGHYVDNKGNPRDDFDSLPGDVGKNGQKTLPDGSVVGVHTSTSTGQKTLHIQRPFGSQNIKIRYPNTNEGG
jgi:RHS repeat-associated protein